MCQRAKQASPNEGGSKLPHSKCAALERASLLAPCFAPAADPPKMPTSSPNSLPKSFTLIPKPPTSPLNPEPKTPFLPSPESQAYIKPGCNNPRDSGVLAPSWLEHSIERS